jgi:hypothetical protein
MCESFWRHYLNPTELGRRMVQCAVLHEWRRFGEATTFAWLERRSGKYLQSSVDYHGTKAVTDYLGGLAITPLGFGTKPTKTGYDFHKECERVFGRAKHGARGRRGRRTQPSCKRASTLTTALRLLL